MKASRLRALSGLQQIQKGTYATIYPFDLASADVIYPLPGYKEKK